MKSKKVYAADLFCGAGGSSSGLLKAAKRLGLNVELLAVNHWDVAIATHSLNHPGVRHVNSDLEKVDPRVVVPGGKLDLLVASPECTHFSKARGGVPVDKQSRASVKYILRWVSALQVKNVIIENVPEFMEWGPLMKEKRDIEKKFQFPLIEFEEWYLKTRRYGGTRQEWEQIYGEMSKLSQKKRLKKITVNITVWIPNPKRKSEYFHRFVRKMKANGYIVKWRVLNAADYGDPTTRKRLFIMCRKGGDPVFPEPTHRKVSTDMFGTLKAWQPARKIIDWSIKGESIFQRKRPLADNTMRRIMAGLMKFGGKAFVIGQQSGAAPRSTDEPLPTVAGAGAISFIEPFIVTTNWTATNRSLPRSVDDPIPAITGQGQIGLAEPFIVEYHGGKGSDQRVKSVDEPLPTQTTENRFGLVEPFILPLEGIHRGNVARSLDEPLNTITSRGAGALVEPFIIPFFGEREGQTPRVNSIDDPLPTITSHGAGALIEPFIIPQFSEGAPRSVDEPLNTITSTSRGIGLVEPFIMPVNHSKYDNRSYSLDNPMPTVTSVDAWSFVEPYLVEYYGTGSAASVEEPLKTQTGRDRFGLVQPMVFESEGKKYLLDIRFRMLQPHELARAMSFPKGYKFSGNREQVVKQIGNAVPVELAAALCGSALHI